MNELAKTPGSWQELAAKIQDKNTAVTEAVQALAISAIVVGHAILEFSQRPDVQAEIAEANTGRRGAKWEPHNYVAQKIYREYGEKFKLPSAHWMGQWARAAKLHGPAALKTISIAKALGWKDGRQSMPEIKPALLMPPAVADKGPEVEPDYGEEIVSGFRAMVRKCEQLAIFHCQQRAKSRARAVLSADQRREIDLLTERMGEWLEHFDYRVSSIQRTK